MRCAYKKFKMRDETLKVTEKAYVASGPHGELEISYD